MVEVSMGYEDSLKLVSSQNIPYIRAVAGVYKPYAAVSVAA